MMQAFSETISNAVDSVVVVLGTGGTIAGTATTAQDVLGYTAAQLGVQALLGSVAGLHRLECGIEAEQVAQVDSKDMSEALWQQLAERIQHHLQRGEVVGIVVTHGTDTIEETAFFLQAVLPAALLNNRPVVLTCAMRPATAADADGPQNLLDALRLASGQPQRAARLPSLPGVVVVCAGVVHSPTHVQKVHPTRLDPFDSGDEPVLGHISTEGVFEATSEYGQPTGLAEGVGWAQAGPVGLPRSGLWPRVEIVLNHAGADGSLVDALLAPKSGNARPLQGLVVAGTGNGSIHQGLLAALLRAQTQGVKVVRCSRCAFGSVQAVAGQALADISALSPVKARIRLMLNLMDASGQGA